MSRTDGIRKQIQDYLHETHDITHTTLQFECTLVPRSLQEILLAFELREFIPFDIDKHKVLVSQPDGPVVDVDMLLPEQNLIVEFDGSYWHRDKAGADARKGGLLRSSGWRVIRLREAPLLPLHEDDVQVPPVALNPVVSTAAGIRSAIAYQCS